MTRSGLDRLTLLRILDTMATTLRRLGLGPLTRVVRRMLGPLLGRRLFADLQNLRIWGSIENRAYLLSLREGRQEAFMVELFQKAVRSGAVVVDIGAYIGTYSLLGARAAGKGGQVYAFEPDPLNFKALQHNIRANGLDEIIRPIRAAVSDSTGRRSLLVDKGDRTQSSLFVRSGEKYSVDIDCVALDDVLPLGTAVSVIKVDIEGGELAALDGMSGVLSRADPNLTMFVECNPSALRSAGGTAEELRERLERAALRVMVIDEKDRRLGSFGRDIESMGYVNLYCTRY